MLLGGIVLGALLYWYWPAHELATRWLMGAASVSLVVLGIATVLLSRPEGATAKAVRRFFILLIGTSVILLGLAGLVLPILQGWLLIFTGLGILASEFAFARVVLRKTRGSANTVARRAGLSKRLRRRLRLEGNKKPARESAKRPEGEESDRSE